MAKLVEGLIQFLGFNGQGDIGELMVYTARKGRKLVFYPRAPPLTPATPEQAEQRNKFRCVAISWQLKTQAEKEMWELTARRAGLRITGYNLWSCWCMKKPTDWFETVIRLAKIDPRK